MADMRFPGLVNDGWRRLAYEHFRDGIEVCWLLKGPPTGPSVAILRYQAGAGVPRHRHAGLETITVLEGVQSDENGDYPAGSVVLNAPGSEHSVWTKAGCVVLIQWNLPVVFVSEGT